MKNNFKQIKVSKNIDIGWYAINISKDTTIRNWIKKQTKDYSDRLKSLITETKCPIFEPSKIKEKFRYHGLNVPCLGATFLLKQLSISFNSSEIWNASQLQIEHAELNKEENITEQKVIVKNATTIAHWEEHYTEIEKLQIANIRKNEKIITKLNEHFPNIIFTNSAKKQLQNDKFTATFFDEIWDVLKKLNNAINLEKTSSLEIIKEKSKLNISDESDTTKQNNKKARHRIFFYDDELHFFGYHVKNFRYNRRLHFIIHNNKIVIGYIGKHLPL